MFVSRTFIPERKSGDLDASGFRFTKRELEASDYYADRIAKRCDVCDLEHRAFNNSHREKLVTKLLVFAADAGHYNAVAQRNGI